MKLWYSNGQFWQNWNWFAYPNVLKDYLGVNGCHLGISSFKCMYLIISGSLWPENQWRGWNPLLLLIPRCGFFSVISWLCHVGFSGYSFPIISLIPLFCCVVSFGFPYLACLSHDCLCQISQNVFVVTVDLLYPPVILLSKGHICVRCLWEHTCCAMVKRLDHWSLDLHICLLYFLIAAHNCIGMCLILG